MAWAWIWLRPNCAHQAFARLARVFRAPNQLDDRVEVVERDLEPFQDMGAGFRLPQLELGPPAHDLTAEFDELVDDLDEVQDLRPPGGDREHDDPERRLQRRVLVEVVEDHLRHLAALQLDDDAHALAIALVADVGDALDHLVVHQLGDPLDQPGLVLLVRNLGDDD